MTQKNPNNIFKEQYGSLFDAYTNVVNAAFSGYKQIAFAQYEAAQKLMEESTSAIKTMLSAKSTSEFADYFKSFAATSVESNLAKAQELYGVINTSKSAFADAASTAIKGAQESLVKTVDGFCASNPSFSKAASESLQTIIATSNQAADAVAKVSAQVSEVASRNFEAATKATLNSVKKAATAVAK